MAIERATKAPFDHTAFVIADLQCPYEDTTLWQITLDIYRRLRPDILVFNGDIFDMHSVGAYAKNAFRVDDVEREARYVDQQIFQPLLKAWKPQQVHFVEGNHEQRLRNYTREKAPALMERLGGSQGLLYLDWVDGYYRYCDNPPYSVYNPAPHIHVLHGDYVRKQPGGSVQGVRDYFTRGHLVTGHCHRLSMAWRQTHEGSWWMVETGHQCDIARVPKGRKIYNWSPNAGTVVRWNGDGTDAQVQLLPVSPNGVVLGPDGAVYRMQR